MNKLIFWHLSIVLWIAIVKADWLDFYICSFCWNDINFSYLCTITRTKISLERHLQNISSSTRLPVRESKLFVQFIEILRNLIKFLPLLAKLSLKATRTRLFKCVEKAKKIYTPRNWLQYSRVARSQKKSAKAGELQYCAWSTPIGIRHFQTHKA